MCCDSNMETLCFPQRKYGCLIFVFLSVILTFDTCFGKTYTVQEEGSTDMFIGNIAKDFNFTSLFNEGKSLRFSFANQLQVSYFSISEDTGEIHTVGVLDREQICPQVDKCDVELRIAVIGNDGLYERVKVNVTIDDINDHAPQFKLKSEAISFPENSQIGTSFTIDGAIDPDSSQLSVKSYTILPLQSPFIAKLVRKFDGSSSVQITVNGTLDREVTDHYEIRIIAADGGSPPKTGQILVNVTITDLNDNSPVFTNKIYNKTVDEDIAINTTILQVSANDPDMGANGKIIYSFASIQKQSEIKDIFAINPTTGEIKTTGHLVYKPGRKYELIVVAKDSGLDPKESQALVCIDVQDVNNNAPVITPNLLSSTNFAKVSELANINVVVALITVMDGDTGLNGVTNCSMDSDTFELKKSDVFEYIIIVKKSLDRETKDLYTLSVFCKDLGTPPLSSNVSFNVSVMDENDHKPEFTQVNYVGEIGENNNYGDVVVDVTATDADTGNYGNVSYELRGESWTDFSINAKTGVIRAMKSFNREEKEYYEFLVLAYDNVKEEDRHTSTATVTVKIVDMNDNNPKFTLAYYEFEIAENNQPDKEIGQVIAVDLDSGNNGIVTYSIVERPEVVLPFKLDPNGFLRAKTVLDRELQSRYDFIIIATDQGFPQRLNSSVNVSVFVTDENDNWPFIVTPDKAGRDVYVPVSTPVNTPLYLIQAHDIDAGKNALLTYRIEDRNDTHIFDINDSGQVLLARPIENNEINTYMIQITVYDNGQPSNQARTSLVMHVLVANTTAGSKMDNDSLKNQNLLIALTVVIVTVVLAVTIVITIIIIRRMDKKKRNYFGDSQSIPCSEENSPQVPNLNLGGDNEKYSLPDLNTQLTPMAPHLSVHMDLTTMKDYIYKPRMNTPTPSMGSNHRDDEVPMTEQMDIQGTSTPRLNRLASIRLQQQLLQSHDKPWTNHNDSNELYPQRAEDSHSQLSEEDDDSGRGGSVSDGHMGISHDGDDMRILQLQNLVKQNGRRGTPPHLQGKTIPEEKYNQSKPSNLTPRDNGNQSNSNTHADQSRDSRHSNLKSTYSNSNSDIFYVPENELKSNIRRYPSYHDNNAPPTQKTVTFSNHLTKPKSGPGIQMGLSSISSNTHNSMRHKPHRQHSFGTQDVHRQRQYPSNHAHRFPPPPNGRHLDETFESVTTTAYDDDDNTTTSGSYTIDNNMNEDFLELNVAQLKDIFV
ncbi:protocadherin-11 X-linked-like [Dreissena polymorpha]|uniref:Cadherin domain-containing protein n=1 Tax=Dreissena polymorpha TaxID=45954 RepID=A0A9D4KP46_DREPO|nr:protocadherin-11 X-linked-like [Dreissena polymorpha]XP_052278163.1 protocadherin-11 X-linked-like [Dreissena polymorpha]KAH3843099.1 hypothetical protein DPMN_116606 [Dreissena polymorpha]